MAVAPAFLEIQVNQSFPEPGAEGPQAVGADPVDTSPAREPVRRAPHREVGIVNAPFLLDHGVAHESHLERAFIMVALACPAVSDVIHQPERMTLHVDGVSRSYTPDFRVVLKDNTRLTCEVKPSVFLAKHKPLLDAAAAEFGKRGETFLVVTDRQLYASGRSARAILLMRYGRLSFSAGEALQARQILEAACQGSATVAALVERGVSESLVWHLVAKHAFRTETPLNLTPSEVVQLNDAQENAHDYFCRWITAADW